MAGEKLAAALKEQPGTVAFWPMTETSPAAAAYESGVRASLEGLENVTLVPSTSEPEAGGLLALLKKLDAIVCLTEEATVEVIEACEESDSSVKIIGRGGNPKAVDALRNDDIEGLLIQNPFQMGYLGVVAIVGQLTGKPLDRNSDSGSFLVTRDSLLHQSVPTGGVIAP